MEEFTPTLVTLISLVVVGLQGLLVVGLLVYLFLNKSPLSYLPGFISNDLVRAAFVVTLGMAMLTLYFEYVAGFEPCVLCWWQRVFLFPQVILLGIAWYNKQGNVLALYSLVLSCIGLAIGLYNYSLLYMPSLAPCVATGVSCAKVHFVEFGYITFPMWAITGFLVLVALMILEKYKNRI